MAFEKKSAPASARQGMNPMLAGIIIGLLLGIFLALGVAIWLNSASTANFVEKTKPTEPLAPMKVPATTTNAKSDAADPNKQRFDFYQILPGEKNANDAKSVKTPELTVPGKEAKSAPAKEVAKDPIKDIATQATPMKSLNETLYLQAGAFQNTSEADNMKAKIAFAGFEANVQSVNVAAKGTLYRVRLGPYKSQDEVNRIKNVLSQNGISAAVVKPE
jgi:cell division protein FtsN